MSDYKRVQEAMKAGAQLAHLCMTCPWDRTCITPPTMTSEEIDAQIADAKERDEIKMKEARANGEQPGLPVGGLLTVLMVGGRDNQATICPVFAARLRSSSGRTLADSMRAQMQSWDDAL